MLGLAVQETSPSPSLPGNADQRAAQAESELAEAGDVGEWLGTDSGRKIVPRGPAAGLTASQSQPHRLSRNSGSEHMDEVRHACLRTTPAWGHYWLTCPFLLCHAHACACCCGMLVVLRSQQPVRQLRASRDLY